MQQYDHFSAEELAAHPDFISWVKQSDSANSALWEAWLNQHPHKAEDVRLARQLVKLWQIVPSVPPAGSQAQVWAAIQANKKALPDQRLSHHKPSRLNQLPYMRWAAVVAGFIITAAVTLWFITNNWGMTHYVTNASETKTVSLPDGSTVILNANSSVRFASVWKPDQPREVALTGEGYFSVKHQQNHQKFRVETPTHLRVEVLGTVFTVDERANQTRVVLNKGNVQVYVADQAKPILMKPGELIDVSDKAQQRVIIRRQVTPEVYSAWTTHQFVFDNTSLTEIAAMLEKEMAYTVQFANPSLGERRMTIRLPNRDVDVLLASIAEANELTITRLGPRSIRIDPAP